MQTTETNNKNEKSKPISISDFIEKTDNKNNNHRCNFKQKNEISLDERKYSHTQKVKP